MDDERSLDRQIRIAMGAGAGPSNPHLEDWEMVEFYRNGSVAGRESSSISQHLADCSQCVEMFRDVRDFVEPATSGESEFASPVEPAWTAVKARLGSSGRPRLTTLPLTANRGRTRFLTILTPALAACLAVVAGLSLIWAIRLKNQERESGAQIAAERQSYQERIESAEQATERLRAQTEQSRRELQDKVDKLEKDASQKQPTDAQNPVPSIASSAVNIALIDVFPEGIIERGGGPGQKSVAVSARSGSFVLILNGGGQANHPGYRIEVLDQSNRIVWRAEGITRDVNGNFNLLLSKTVTPRGEYRLRLYGVPRQAGVDKDTPMAEYHIRVGA